MEEGGIDSLEKIREGWKEGTGERVGSHLHPPVETISQARRTLLLH